jgi:hypothetical protein
MIDANIYQSNYQVKKYLPTEDGQPPLGNAHGFGRGTQNYELQLRINR